MRGGSSQDRRRTRRAGDRRIERGQQHAATDITAEEVEAFVAIVAAAEADGFAAASPCANCDHAYSDHLGKAGPCTMEDCSCTGYTAAEESAVTPEALALERFDAAAPHLFAVGDAVWSREEGFADLLCDVNALLETGRAVDLSVALDKALVRVDSALFVAPILVGRDGAPIVGGRETWQTTDEPAASPASRLRGMLTEFVLTADAGVALPDAHQPGSTLPKPNASPAAPDQTATGRGAVAWEALFLPEATLTDDGRAFAPGAITWRNLPLTLMAMTETSEGGHIGAEVAGRIDNVWRDGNLIRASGVFDGGDYGVEIARMVADGVLRGLSVDTAIHEYEVGPRADYFDEDGNWIADLPPASDADTEEKDLVDLLFGDDDAERIFVVTKAVIGMATVCPFPAFADANISLVSSGAVWRYTHQAGFIVTVGKPDALVASAVAEAPAFENGWTNVEPEALTAGAAGVVPLSPPAEWFENPGLEELTPLTITEDGRIYGHAWTWDTCHLSFPDVCILAPRSETENAYFHLGEIECEDGEMLAVGKITLDTGHAGPRASRTQAAAHYDDTGAVAAHVRCGEDEFGGWVAGAINPAISEEKLRVLRGAVLSGDWRAVQKSDGTSNLELVALLAVNVPGFPVPRQPKALVASSGGLRQVLALTAAGVVVEPTEEEELATIAEIGQREDLAAIAVIAAQASDCGCTDA